MKYNIMLKHLSRLLIVPFIILSLLSCENKSEKIILAGSGWNKIAIIDKESKQIEWEHPIENGWECNSVASTKDGNVLFSYSKGAKLINKNHEDIWDIKAPENCEVQTARVLKNGNYLIAWAGFPAVILEVDKKGNTIKRTE